MAQDQVTTPLNREQAYKLVDAAMEREDLALTASAHEDETTGEWIFEATCDSPPDLEAFNALARAVLGGDVGFAVKPVETETDWVSQSLAGLHPVRAGGFYIFGSHAGAPAPVGTIPIKIEAARAFGTGHHETTTGCLEALDQVLRSKKPARPLDVGTGTGILAIAAAKRLRVPIVASDIDPIAVDITRENARINAVAPFVIPITATGLTHKTIRGNAPFDLIMANILAGPLVGLAPLMGLIAAPGASVIVSGLLEHQAQRVRAVYRQHGMVAVRRLVRKRWATLIFEKRA